VETVAQIPQIFTEPSRDIPVPVEKPAGPRVLVVDDERLLRWSVAETLTGRGYEVEEASDARTAMQAFGEGDRTDLVLLDLRLPDTDDLRVLAKIREKAPTVPVILMTAFATREIVEDAHAMGTPVLNKPFDLDDLARCVERVLAGRVY
jgi:two-component system response regulator AtoC